MGTVVNGQWIPMTEHAPGDLFTCAKDDCDCLIRVERPCPHGGAVQCGCGGEMVPAIAGRRDHPDARRMTRSYEIHIGDQVSWTWGDGQGTGTVIERFTDRVTRTIKGTEVTRDASTDDPAYLIEQDDGDQVLKSGSELSTQS